LTLKANWFDTVDTKTEDNDPFAGTTASLLPVDEPGDTTITNTAPRPVPQVRDLGQDEDGNGSYPQADRFTMLSSIEDLEARLRELLKREGNCFDAGITCALKDHPEMTCSACPFHEVGQDTRKSALCRLSKEQERILSILTAKHAGYDPTRVN
jgi:hypothetical protein